MEEGCLRVYSADCAEHLCQAFLYLKTSAQLWLSNMIVTCCRWLQHDFSFLGEAERHLLMEKGGLFSLAGGILVLCKVVNTLFTSVQ